MKRYLALRVEWAWSQGLLATSHDLETFVLAYGREVARRHGAARARHFWRGVEEIAHDVRKILRALTYGGRRAEDIPPQRLAYLRSQSITSAEAAEHFVQFHA